MNVDEVLAKMDTLDANEEKIQYIIDENLRIISIPPLGVVLGVEGDKDVNSAKFKMVRYYKGIDLSKFEIRINFANANGDLSYYTVKNPTVMDDTLTFEWLVGYLVTKYKGTVRFVVRMIITDSSTGEVQQAFDTTIGKAQSLEGLLVDVPTDEKVYDIVAQLKTDLTDHVNNLLKTIPEDYNELTKNVKDKVDKPSVADNNKIPRANGGEVEWVEVGQPTDEQTNSAVANWLNDHPEATTTVQDGSITDIKINESLLNRINQSYNPTLINIKSNVNVGQTPFLDGYTYDLCGHTITIEKAIGNNLSFRNGKIVLPSEYRFTDVHGLFVLENIVIESDFWSAHNIYCDDIRITNCKFTNIAFGFPDSKQVYINNNRFICTVDNSASTVGSEEFIHINPSTPLDVCVISNNYFYGSQNDCIDCFPAGFVTKIIGNTFDECSDTIIELKSHYRDQGHPNGNTEQSVDGIIISENVFKNVKRRTSNAVCINIYATDERTGIVDKDFSFYPKVTISDCIFDNSNNEKVVCIRIAAEGGVVLVSNCRTFAKNSQDDDDANGTFVKGESGCTVYISNCYTTTKNFLEKGTSTVGIMTARVSNCYGRYITDFVDNIYMNNTKIHRIFSKKGNMRILTNCELTDNYTPNSDSVLIGCFVKNIFSPSVTDGINVKITNSFYTGSISSSSLIESVGNVKIV
jgi:hypothetical protein